MRSLLLDDQLLLRLLLGDEPPKLRTENALVATTGLWYHRLCRAVSDVSVVGSMSSRLGQVEQSVARRVVSAIIELPEGIELVSLRTLGWLMAEIVNEGSRLNLLSLEAVAAARLLNAEICLAEVDANLPLMNAAASFGVTVRVIAE